MEAYEVSEGYRRKVATALAVAIVLLGGVGWSAPPDAGTGLDARPAA